MRVALLIIGLLMVALAGRWLVCTTLREGFTTSDQGVAFANWSGLGFLLLFLGLLPMLGLSRWWILLAAPSAYWLSAAVGECGVGWALTIKERLTQWSGRRGEEREKQREERWRKRYLSGWENFWNEEIQTDLKEDGRWRCVMTDLSDTIDGYGRTRLESVAEVLAVVCHRMEVRGARSTTKQRRKMLSEMYAMLRHRLGPLQGVYRCQTCGGSGSRRSYLNRTPHDRTSGRFEMVFCENCMGRGFTGWNLWAPSGNHVGCTASGAVLPSHRLFAWLQRRLHQDDQRALTECLSCHEDVTSLVVLCRARMQTMLDHVIESPPYNICDDSSKSVWREDMLGLCYYTGMPLEQFVKTAQPTARGEPMCRPLFGSPAPLTRSQILFNKP